MSERRFGGGCLCGAVRYEATGEPAVAPAFCHCRSCRRASGAPITAWVTWPVTRFAWTGGAPVEFRSSPPVVRRFCGACGSALTYQHDAYPETLDVTCGTLDDPDALAPVDHVWTSDGIAWMQSDDGRPHLRGRRGDG